MFQMAILLFALLTFGTCCATFDSSLDGLWSAYKIRYAKQYNSEAADMHRRNAFENNVALINKHNLEAGLELHSYRMGLNQISDLTAAEYRQTLLGTKPSDLTDQIFEYSSPAEYILSKLPTSVDWRKKGYVTPVMDQGECGDCWAFSPLEALEGQHKAVSGKLVKLSVANLVNCVPESQGCRGGSIASAYTYMITHGIDTAACYPDSEAGGACKYNKTCVGATMKGVAHIKSGNEHKLQYSTAKIGPISVAIDASNPSFQSYSSGVYDDPDCSSVALDHAVLVVGYGVLGSKDFWIVKNSWGTSWGMKGYILMSRNKKNQCGIATEATYPTGCGF